MRAWGAGDSTALDKAADRVSRSILVVSLSSIPRADAPKIRRDPQQER